jgi:ribonuclease Y
LETLTGVDLIIDDTPEAITLSSHDPVKREIARIALEKLIQDGRIHPSRIEEMVEKAGREVESKIKQDGERASMETGVHGMHPELVRLLGRMRYRTSYGQNVLEHSIEVANLAGVMAAEIGANVALAKRAGLLHDIGKALTHKIEGSHVQIGVDVARKYKENPEVIHAIEAHHGDVEPSTTIACLVQAADAISAARPGARRENIENYIKRLEKLEEITNSFNGVEKSFAIQAGREIRVLLRPDIISDDQLTITAREICKKIEEELDYPGQIKVHCIRENRAIEYAK